MPARKRLLFVTDVFPHPLDRGQRIRVQKLLDACGRACDVTFVGPPPARDSDREEVERYCSRAVYVADGDDAHRSSLGLAMEAARLAPGAPRLRTIRTYSPFLAALQQARAGEFDIVWAERPHIARLCARFQERTILDLDDIEHVKIQRSLKLQPNRLKLAHNLYRYVLYRNLELSGSRRFRAVIVCSEEDREYLRRHGSRNVLIVRNGVDVASNGHRNGSASGSWNGHGNGNGAANGVYRPRPADGPMRVVFVGNVGYAPNADAIAFFANQILPVLHARRPDATFDVIGPGVTPELAGLYATRVRFRGFVEDLGAALQEYDVLAAPLRFGSGTKLKVLDAMAHKIPLVITGTSGEGLSLRHGEHAWISDTVEDFVEGLVQVKTDPELAARMVRNAYSLVRERFSWQSIQDGLAEWLSALGTNGT